MALALAEAGADIIITGRTQETLDATVAEIRRSAARPGAWRPTWRWPPNARRPARRSWPRLGPIDIVINNVGNRIASMPIVEETLETWQEMIDLNLTSCFLGTKIFGAAMLKRGQGGRIINIASISAMIANRGIGGRDYETGKAAVIHFTRCAAADWAPHGITVNAICPGLFMTDTNRAWNEKRPDVIDAIVTHIPMGRPGNPTRSARLRVYLASPAANYVTGAAYVIDGGYTVW